MATQRGGSRRGHASAVVASRVHRQTRGRAVGAGTHQRLHQLGRRGVAQLLQRTRRGQAAERHLQRVVARLLAQGELDELGSAEYPEDEPGLRINRFFYGFGLATLAAALLISWASTQF